jgi:hypothetical protein
MVKCTGRLRFLFPLAGQTSDLKTSVLMRDLGKMKELHCSPNHKRFGRMRLVDERTRHRPGMRAGPVSQAQIDEGTMRPALLLGLLRTE